MKEKGNKIKNWKIDTFIDAHKRLIIFVLIIAVLLIVFFIRGRDNPDSNLTEVEVGLEDIYTYRSFSGNVETTTETPVISKVSSQVTDVYVSEGDEVKAGDVLAIFDSSSVENSIELKEASLSSTEITNSYNIQDAQRNYDDYKYALENGLNSSLVSAQQNVDSARSSRDDAEDDYYDTKEAIKDNNYSGTYSYYENVKSAQNSYNTASSEYNTAVSTYNSAKSSYEAAQSAYETALSNKENNIDEEKNIELESQLTSAKTALESAKTAMDSAKSDMEAKKTTMDSALSVLNSAQTAYDNANDDAIASKKDIWESAEETLNKALENYSVVELQVQQQLESYEAALEKVKATSSTETSQIELEQLEDSLDDYTLVAPCDGTITKLNLAEGAMATSGTTAATISNLNSLEVAINIDEYSILETQVGSDVIVYADSIGMEYTGTLTWIADTATLNNGVSYFEATVVFQSDEYIRSGMSVEVRVTSADEKDTLAVPVIAVDYYDNNTAYVLVKNESGGQEERSVEIGVSDGNYVQILSGLDEGDVIYVDQTQSSQTFVTPLDMIQGVD